MNLMGTVVNGGIVLDQPAALPDGTRVEIQLNLAPQAASPLREALLKLAGTAVGLPADMAEQHDHYIHGTLPLPARQPRKPGNCKGMLTILAEDDEHLQDFAEYMS